jgi:hypothetical protein
MPSQPERLLTWAGFQHELFLWQDYLNKIREQDEDLEKSGCMVNFQKQCGKIGRNFGTWRIFIYKFALN